MTEYNRYLKLATDRFAWPGGYEIFFVTDDGGTLCSPCVEKEWDGCIADAYPNDGWNIVGFDHTGNTDEAVTCDHCNREVQAAWKEDG